MVKRTSDCSRHVARALGPLRAAIEQRLRLRPRATMDRHTIAGREQMAAHRRSHHTGADPADGPVRSCDFVRRICH